MQTLNCKLGLNRSHRWRQSLPRGTRDKPGLLRYFAGLRARWGVREHIFLASGMITSIDNRGISLSEREREKERCSVGGRTPDNAVPPDTHPSRAVCNYPRPCEIIYECKKDRGREEESEHYTYARELRHKVLYFRWRRSLWSSLRGGESHKSTGGSLPPTSISSYYLCRGNTPL